MMEALFDMQGRTAAWTDDSWVYDASGSKPIAFLNGKYLYKSDGGAYMGWMEDGWVYDTQGEPIWFKNGAPRKD